MKYLADILSQIPTSLVNRAKPILDIMLVSKSLLRWNDDMELVIKDDVIPNTNVPELILHTLQSINTDRPPNGFSEFITCLHVLGLESKYAENEYAIQVLDQDLDSSDSDSSGSEVESSDDEAEEPEGDDHEELEKDNEEEDESSDENEELEIDDQNDELEIDGNDDENDQLEIDENDDLEGDNDDEVEEKPEVEWLSVDDVDTGRDIYINSMGYYKRV